MIKLNDMIKHEQVKSVVTLKEVKRVFNKWLYLEDDNVLDIVYGTVVANRWDCDPFWLFLVAPSGSGKTEILRTFKRTNGINLEGFYSLSKVTEHTLISGLQLGNSDRDYSLLPKLDGKVVIIKDFTSVLNMRRDARAGVFNDFRECYDGYLEKEYGSAVQSRGFKAKFGIIAGVTPVIDKFHAFNQLLGERFLKFRIRYKDRKKLREKSKENNSRKKEMRQELSRIVEKYLASLEIPNMEKVFMPEEISLKIEKAADFLAIARSSISRNGYTKQVECLPEPENPGRIVGQLEALIKGIAVARGKTVVDNDDYAELIKVIKDSLPSTRLEVIKSLVINKGWNTTREISNYTKLPLPTVKILLEDLNMLELIDTNTPSEEGLEQDGVIRWKIKDSTLDVILETEL